MLRGHGSGVNKPVWTDCKPLVLSVKETLFCHIMKSFVFVVIISFDADGLCICSRNLFLTIVKKEVVFLSFILLELTCAWAAE